MARFDIYPGKAAHSFLLDCQADALSDLNTRFVVPLLRPSEGPRPISRLNPEFHIGGDTFIMYTQFAAAASVRELGQPATSLALHHETIMNALDMLLTGY